MVCPTSVRFRSFEDDLVSTADWVANKDALLAAAGIARLIQPLHEQLAELEADVEDRIVGVNQRIAAGDNTHCIIKQHGKRRSWTLQYPTGTEPINHPLFGTVPQINIGSVLQFANDQCAFLTCFDHLLGRYTKQAPDDHQIMAALVAWGTTMGLGRMGEISDIPFATLTSTSDNFLRRETLKAANVCVSNAIAALPIFRHYDLGGVHQ